jgi:hypothetical protein
MMAKPHKERPPIIIIGMHRSGTTLLTRVLNTLGLFIGNDPEINSESRFFLGINEWLLTQAGGSWHNPIDLSDMPEFKKKLLADIITNRLNSCHRLRYLGILKSLKYRSFHRLNFGWGWKDPRNTFTFDIWKMIFPDAKVIHIYRHPVDVINSLLTRDEEINGRFLARPRKTGLKRLLYSYRLPRKSLFLQPFEQYGYETAFKLWKKYVEKALIISDNSQEMTMSIKFEELMDNPEEIIGRLIRFVDISTSRTRVEQSIGMLDKRRKFAFLASETLREFYMQIKDEPILAKLGYDKVVDMLKTE